MRSLRAFAIRPAPRSSVAALIFVLASFFVGHTSLMAQTGATPIIEEIIVTATKREASIQDVPVSMTAFTSEDLEKLGAVEFFDYATAVPNLSFGFAGEGRQTSRQFQIRGIFGSDTSALYINDTPVPVTMDPRVLDVDRIEILRGPQGSLFGSRSMGGLVRLHTKTPDYEEMSTKVHARVGSVAEGGEDYQIDGSVNIPMDNGMGAVRVSAYYLRDAGFLNRIVDPDASQVLGGATSGDEYTSSEINEDETIGLQLVGQFEVTDNLMLRPEFLYQKFESDGPAFVDNEIDNFDKVRQFNVAEEGLDEWLVVSLTAEIGLERGEIVSSTSFFNRETSDLEDGTLAISVAGLGTEPVLTYEVGDEDRFTQEIRYVSSLDGPLQYIVGGFYQEIDRTGGFPPESKIAPGSFFDIRGWIPAGTSFFYLLADSTRQELGVFGELSYDFSDAWTATLGGRWFDVEAEASRTDGGALFGVFYGIPGGEIRGGTFDQSESGFNPRLGLQFAASEDVNLFANVAKGFRPGGVNNGAGACAVLGNPIPSSFDSDSVWNYEVGAKSRLMDGSLTLNATFFHMQWEDYRAATLRCPFGFGGSENTGEAESQGFELDILAVPADGLTLSLGVGYTDAEITDAGAALSIEQGDPLPNVPEWTGIAAIDQSFDLQGEMEGYWYADYRYVGKSISRNGLDRPSYSLVTLRAGVRTGSWDVSIFADNLTDEQANLADPNELSDGLDLLAVNRPRTIGVDLRFSL